MELKTFGTLELVSAEDGEVYLRNAHSLAILAYLAANPRHEASREFLGQLFWPHAQSSRQRRLLRQTIYYLHSKVRQSPLRTTRDTLAIDTTSDCEVDLWNFEEAVDRGDYTRAVDLYSGLFLDSYRNKASGELTRWIESEAQAIHRQVQTLFDLIVRRLISENRADKAADYAWEAVRINPLSGSAQSLLTSALLAAGNPSVAYRAYERYQLLLQKELDEAPDSEVRETLQLLRQLATGQDPAFVPKRLRAAQSGSSSQRLPDGAADVAVVIHSDGVIQDANRGAVEMAGASSLSDLVDTSIERFISRRQLARMKERLHQIEDGQVAESSSCTIESLDGDRIQVTARGMPVKDGEHFILVVERIGSR